MTIQPKIKVMWPLTADNDDEVCDWLEDLTKNNPTEIVFELRNKTTIYFAREDDAIAFRLKFRL